jgi:tetratricopeptide (TPR) repeat protein
VSPREGYERARAAARQAIARDSSQALAYAVLGNAVLALDLDAREAERLARRAVALDPNGGWPRWNLSFALYAAGRVEESISEAGRAWQSDSLDSGTAFWYAKVLIRGHHFDSATALLPRFRAIMSPSEVDPIEGLLLATRGDLRAAEHLLSWRFYGGEVAVMYVRALLARGDTLAARATIDSMLAARTPDYYNPVALAGGFAALGDIDRGMEWLQRAFEERTSWVFWVRLDDELAPLRADPRYAALDRQLRY